MATILVVDDRPSNRQFLTTLLGYGSHRLVEASDGAQALKLTRAVRPDLVITDILMPNMDGFEYVQQLRNDPELAPTPVIFYTATYSAPEARTLAQSCRVDIVLPKPCDPQQILAAVNKALGVEEPAAALSAAAGKGFAEMGELGRADDTAIRYVKDLQAVKLGFDEVIEHSEKLIAQRDLARGLSKKLAANVDSLQRVMSRLSALVEVGMEMESERDPAKLVHLFFAAACDIVDSKYAAVALLDEPELTFGHLYAKGIDPDLYRTGDNGRSGLLGSLLSGRRAIRARSLDSAMEAEKLAPGHPSVRNVLAVPVASAARTYGWLYFADKPGAKEFSAEDERLANIMATKLALLYDNLMLYDVIQRHAATLQLEAAERKRVEHQLQRFRTAMDTSGDGIILVDRASMRYIDVNQTLCDLIGYTREELLGMAPMDVFNADRKVLERDYDSLIADNSSSASRVEGEYRCKDGSLIPIETRRRALHTGDGWIVVGIARDITERKRADDRIRRLNRVYAVLSGINSAIVRIRSRDELFIETCRIAVDLGGFGIAQILIVDEDAYDVSPGPSAGVDVLPVVRSSFRPGAETISTQGTTIRAIRERKPAFTNDITAEPPVGPLRVQALKGGYGSVISLPLIVQDRVVAVLLLVAKEKNFFDDQELRLLGELAGDIAFSLDAIEKKEKLDHLAFYDQLTGLANRALFLDRVNQSINAAGQVDGKFALAILDIERLRTINESLGRQAGDALIKLVSERLKIAAGPRGVSRISADHFALLLGTVKGRSEAGRIAADALRKCFDGPFQVNGTELRISAKAGVALFPGDGTGAEVLLRNAEAALRKGKEGGDRVTFHAPEMTARMAENLSLENKLRQALEKEEFVLHYQPKVELETRRIVGVEALIRWQSPERGLVPPGLFIPLLEETGLILQVGAWALRRAVIDHGIWLQQGVAAPRIAVNVSAIQLRQRDFVEVVKEAISRGADPAAIDVEITESLLMDDVAGNITKLKALRELGMKISIDDFGTGYSSLGYLAKLPVHTLKIDRSFIIAMLKEADTMTLVQTIISLAHSLRLDVVAEGVEEEEQAKMLRLLRCDQMQGYLFCKPVPFDHIAALLNQGKRAE